MHEIRNDGPDRVYPVQEQEVKDRLAAALSDPAVQSVAVHKPGSEFTIQNGPFAGRRYQMNDQGQMVRIGKVKPPFRHVRAKAR